MLLVDDFSVITSELLRIAYIEAIYRVYDFQFEKLNQNFWWDFLRNITTPSATGTINKHATTTTSSSSSNIDYILNKQQNSNGKSASGLIKDYFPVDDIGIDSTFSRSAWSGYFDNGAHGHNYQCVREDLGGGMGTCYRFPETIC